MRKRLKSAARKVAMMRYRLTSGVLMMALLAFPGTCKKKKPEVPPPQATPPTVTQPQPQAPPPTTGQQPEQQPEQQQKTEEQPQATKPAPKPKPRTNTTHKKPQPEMKKTGPPATTTNRPTTTPPVNNNDTGQLTASLPTTEVARRKQETAQLLAVTDGELKSITRTLSSDEQNIVLQIRGYMQQAQAADRDGDLDRSHNLAVKAKLLADDLAKK